MSSEFDGLEFTSMLEREYDSRVVSAAEFMWESKGEVTWTSKSVARIFHVKATDVQRTITGFMVEHLKQLQKGLEDEQRKGM